jgi:IS1 family transposase
MIPHHVYYQLAVVGFLWLCLMLHYVWPSQNAVSPQPPAEPLPPRSKRNRTSESKPFAGLTQRPPCAACDYEAHHPTPSPPRRPDPMPATNRRPCVIDTSMHFCPHKDCEYRGWPGLGNLRANGHPSGGPWRQLYCRSCHGYFLETHGTIFHGKRLPVELIVYVLACLAEGLGIRATARVFAVDPNTVLQWLVEAAEQLQAFTSYFLCDVHVHQLQLDELYVVLRGLRDGELSEEQALQHLEPGRPWVWTAIDPVSKLLLAIEIGPRTAEMAQRVVHQIVSVLAPGCVPAWFSDGFKGYLPAIVGHFGEWMHPERRQDKGPRPQPRWMPLPGLLYAQVVKQYRRKRVVGVKPRVVFGTMEAVAQVLAACGWKINTAMVERLNLDIRQRVAGIGRRVNTLCQGEAGLQHQLALFHVYDNFVLPHASLRQPLAVPEPTHGTGSARLWRPCTPAMAAGLTDRVWTLREVLLYRVPPWPQPQAV